MHSAFYDFGFFNLRKEVFKEITKKISIGASELINSTFEQAFLYNWITCQYMPLHKKRMMHIEMV